MVAAPELVEAAALVAVLGGIFTAGGFVFRSCGGSNLTWEDKVDLACGAAYSDMVDAASRTGTDRATAEAKVEHDFVRQLDRQRGDVPVSLLLDYNGFVNAHRRIAQLRDERAARTRGHKAPRPGFSEDLSNAQVTAQFAAMDLHLGICGAVDPNSSSASERLARESRADPRRGVARSSGGRRPRAVGDGQVDARALHALPSALYAGLRNGELRALRIEDLNMDTCVIHVDRSMDSVEGEIDPKSKAGKRVVPICDHLRVHLELHLTRLGDETGLVFGETATVPCLFRRARPTFKMKLGKVSGKVGNSCARAKY